MSAVAASVVLAFVVVIVWITPPRFVRTCTFMPKYHWCLFYVCRISGSRVFVAYFVELSAPMMVSSTMIQAFSTSFRASGNSFTASSIRTVS